MSRTDGDADENRSDRTHHVPASDVADGMIEPNVARLDQPEDEATEHALRLMNEALRQSDAGRRWLVSENP